MAAVREQFKRNWWNAPEGKVSGTVIPYVRSVENYQAEYFDKLVKLEATYDVNPRTNRYTPSRTGTGPNRNSGPGVGTGNKAIITENLIATCIDTVAANVADTDIRARIQTDGADWSHQRTAKRLETYVDGLSKLFDIGPKCRTAFKSGAALKGTGVIKVWIDRWDQLQVTNVPVDNIIVDELECRDADPKQLHYRDFFDKESLAAQFPEFGDQIARSQSAGDWRIWAGYRPVLQSELVVIESWRLPLGPKGHKLYVPGRHTLCIDGLDLLDEEYHKPHFPFMTMRWNRPSWGWYGIGLAERVLPFQNLLNRRHYQVNTSIDGAANPIKYVKRADQDLQAKTIPQIGAVAVYNDVPPVTLEVAILNKEVYQSINDQREGALRQTGLSQASVQGTPAAGIDSGVGVRELRTDRSQIFSIQDKEFERGWLMVLWLMLDCCKDLGDKSPDILKVSKFGNTKIKWSDVDMGDLKIELAAASTLTDSPAGRRQAVTEMAQAGTITLDESRELYDYPDIKRITSLYNAMLEDIEYTIWRLEEGEQGVTPEPYQNLTVGVTMMEKEYLLIKANAPEAILEAMADWMAVASGILNPRQVPGNPADQMAMPTGPGAPPAGVAPPMPQGPAAQMAASASTYAPGTFAPSAA